MTQFSTKAAIPYAELTDPPNMQTYAQGVAAMLDGSVCSKYGTVTDRNAANPVPTGGDLAYCADTEELYVYRSTQAAWVGLVSHTVVRNTPFQVANNNSSYIPDSVLVYACEASSVYEFAFHLMIGATSAGPHGDFHLSLGASSTTTFSYTTVAMDENPASGHVTYFGVNRQAGPTTTGSSANMSSLTTPGKMLIAGIIEVGPACTLGYEMKQHNSSGTNSQVLSGSFLRIQKVG